MTEPNQPTRPNSRPALIASASRVRLSTTASPPPPMRTTLEKQRDAWTSYENVGEIQHAVDYIANHISKVRLFGAMVPTDPRNVPTTDDNDAADVAIRSLRTEGGEYSAILRELTVNLYVAGECYLIGHGNFNDEAAYWEIRSTDEVRITSDKFQIRDYPSGPFKDYGGDEVVVIRIYFSHPRWGGLAISPIWGILASAEEIQRIERVIRGAARSRSAGPGLLLIPDEASFGNFDPTTDTGDGGEAQNDPFIKALMDGMMTPIQQEDDPSGVIPLILRAPADVLKEIRKVDLGIDVDEQLIKLDRAITRLAQGLPLPPEIVTGKQGLSHWSAWSVSEDTITAYIEPVLAPVVSALTTEYYRPFLIATGMSEEDARARMLYYDVTQLVTRPNRSADADFGLEHIAISDDAWRKVKGFSDEDAPSGTRAIARLMLQRGSFDPATTTALMKAAGILPESFEPPLPTKQVPPTKSPPSATPPEDRSPPDMNRPKDNAPPNRAAASILYLPPATADAEQLSAHLAELDRDLRVRLQVASEAAVTRAVERASATVIQRMGKKSRYSTMLRDIPKLEAASRIGRPAFEAEGGEVSALFNGAFDSIATKFRDWTTRTYAKASRILDLPITTPTDLITSCADSLAAELTTFAERRLFDLQGNPEPYGEDDGSTLPHGIVRSALYRAGGGVDLLPTDQSPPGGIATGANVLRTVVDAGGEIEGYEWNYSTAAHSREFEPHLLLNGVRFTSFRDPVLRNPGTWPPVTTFFPGDHPACGCSLRPLLRLPDQQKGMAS